MSQEKCFQGTTSDVPGCSPTTQLSCHPICGSLLSSVRAHHCWVEGRWKKEKEDMWPYTLFRPPFSSLDRSLQSTHDVKKDGKGATPFFASSTESLSSRVLHACGWKNQFFMAQNNNGLSRASTASFFVCDLCSLRLPNCSCRCIGRHQEIMRRGRRRSQGTKLSSVVR